MGGTLVGASAGSVKGVLPTLNSSYPIPVVLALAPASTGTVEVDIYNELLGNPNSAGNESIKAVDCRIDVSKGPIGSGTVELGGRGGSTFYDTTTGVTTPRIRP